MMRKHELSVTMAKRETDFINDCMGNNELEMDEQYDWKFMFDDMTTVRIVISGANKYDAGTMKKLGADLESPVVYSSAYGENWAVDNNEEDDEFWGEYWFEHGDDLYVLTIYPARANVST